MASILQEMIAPMRRWQRAAEAIAFRKQYPYSRRLKGDHSWAINRSSSFTHIAFEPFAKDWLNRFCPGWGVLHMMEMGWGDPVSYIGFAEPEHVKWFQAAESMLAVREEHLGRRDRCALHERRDRALDMAHFRSMYPLTQRYRRAKRLDIWEDDSIWPCLRDDVREWLDDQTPGWKHLPRTYYLGFEVPEHAVCFKTVWG